MDFPHLFLVVADALDSGLVIVNAERTVCYINRRAEEILEVRANLASGHGLIALLRDYQVDALASEVLHDHERRETTIQTPLSKRTLRVRCSPLLLDSTLTGALFLIEDVTHISQLERSRRDMVANVSHELRTPLASLKLLVETLQSDPPAPVRRRMLGQISHEVDAVTQLAEELHELSQIESGRVTIQLAPTSIGPVIERALNRIRPQAERKNILVQAIIIDNQLPVLIDNRRIDQVLLNLLHNAVKFTSDGGQITVRTQTLYVDETGTWQTEPAVSRDNTPTTALELPDLSGFTSRLPVIHSAGLWMLISISDTGIGIPTEELPRIFERFYKVDRSRNRNAGGTGLGLAIAKHLIEGHGGRLWADSRERYGSTFHFTLPVG
ncbi:MAG: PAS domain-containing sensor histidine kinase [Chloroflexaceae bacterium]|nr:PAS domain-containing sensor histidine kinase [Chloroflexaceae bacterium]NJO07348.1 PAS domain-containing sensor histidine kinase [Chloroflexaceae bacterium]